MQFEDCARQDGEIWAFWREIRGATVTVSQPRSGLREEGNDLVLLRIRANNMNLKLTLSEIECEKALREILDSVPNADKLHTLLQRE